MKKRIINCLLAVALLSATAGTFVSCKDYDGDAQWNEQIAKNSNLIEALTQQVNALKTAQANCQTQCKTTQDSLARITKINAAAIAANGSAISTLQQNLSALQTQLNKNSADIAANKTAIANAEAAIQKNANAIDLLNSTVAANGRTIAQNSADIIALQTRVTTLENTVAKIQETVDKNYQALQAADQEIKDNMGTQFTAVNSRIDSVVNVINSNNQTALEALALARQDSIDIATLQTAVGGLQNAVGGIQSTMNTLIEQGTTLVTTLQSTLVGLQQSTAELYTKAYNDSLLAADAHKIAEQANQLATENLGKINGLNASVSAINATVANLEEAYKAADKQLQSQIDALSDRVTALENAVKLQVTSINVNGTDSPILGYFALPSGDVRSTVLAAYYGNAAEFRFPTSTLSFYADQNNTLSAADLEITGNTSAAVEGGKVIVTEDGAEGNAGTIYLTLNPTSTDLTGKTFALVNSQGEVSPITLSSVVSSDRVLGFGYTRANTNGFYEAKATVSADIAPTVQPTLKLSDLRTAAAEIMNSWNSGSVDITKITTLIYNNINNVLPALALKTSWNENGTVNSTLSQYSVAATAVHPLSFGTLKDLNVKLPTITAIEQLDNNVENVTVTPAKSASQLYRVNVEDVNGQIDTYTTAQLDSIIDVMNKNFNELANKSIDKMNSALTLFNNISNRLSNAINSFNRRLQPVVFINKGGQFYQLSQAPYGTDAIASGSSITLTTYTAELLAPAYKKWVAVTNVWGSSEDATKDKVGGETVASAQNGDAALKAALQSANSGTNMNKVVFGTTRSATLGTLQSGKVYEISYSCVDYSGKVAARKFYVRGE